MKTNKTKFLSLALLSILFSFLLSSCTKDPSQEVAITTPEFDLETYEGQLAYTDYHLKVLAKSVGKVANKEAFKEALYTQVESYDQSTLLEGLANSDNGGNSTLRSDFVASALSNDEDFNKALDAFKEVSEYTHYPQIYIPFYENHKDNENTDPTIIFSLVDTGGQKLEFTGYKFDENGALYELDYLIDEEYAMNNEVWVFSLSDTYLSPDEPTVSNSNGRVAQTSRDLRFPYMIVECNKEDWSSGASEVHILTIFSKGTIVTEEDYEENLYGGHKYQGGKIRDYSRKEVKNESKKTTNFYVLNDWSVRQPLYPYGSYVVFEYDPWPVGIRTACYSLPGGIICNEYRSSDTYYDSRTIDRYNQPSYSYYDRSCIRYPLEYDDLI